MEAKLELSDAGGSIPAQIVFHTSIIPDHHSAFAEMVSLDPNVIPTILNAPTYIAAIQILTAKEELAFATSDSLQFPLVMEPQLHQFSLAKKSSQSILAPTTPSIAEETESASLQLQDKSQPAIVQATLELLTAINQLVEPMLNVL